MEARALRNAICLTCLNKALKEDWHNDKKYDIEQWKEKIRREKE
jgi:hypothetical protein